MRESKLIGNHVSAKKIVGTALVMVIMFFLLMGCENPLDRGQSAKSFDIVGKWKNVGDTGLGLAEPGAIVVFNGTHCNFFSPNDTYAFYKDGDTYVLDVTGLLGGSFSKTVTIKDENNIEVGNISLTRIE